MFTVIMFGTNSKGGGQHFYKTGLTVVEQKNANSLPDRAEHKEHLFWDSHTP